MSVKTGLKIFNMKVLPVATYCLREISPFLSLANLLQLDIVKSLFLKRLLGLPRNASATLAHELAETPFMIEELASALAIREDVRQGYCQTLDERRLAFCVQRFTDGPAFKTREWSRPMASNRHFVTAYTSHGFHHLICNDPEFHSIGQDCVCHICGQEAIERYHATECPAIPQNCSLSEIFKLLCSETQQNATGLQ